MAKKKTVKDYNLHDLVREIYDAKMYLQLVGKDGQEKAMNVLNSIPEISTKFWEAQNRIIPAIDELLERFGAPSAYNDEE